MYEEQQTNVPRPIPPSLRPFHLAGSLLGFIIFVLVGYRIGIEFGTFGGRLLADDLVPNDIAYQNLQGIVMSVGTVLGIVLAFLCTLSFFLIIGAIAGDLFGRLTLLVFRSRGESG